MSAHQHYDDAALDFTHDYAEVLVQLASVRIDQPALEHVLGELLQVTADVMTGAIAISVTAIEHDGSLTTAASTSEAARQVDAFEYSIDEGPCITALLTGEEQILEDVETDPRWPRFGQRAAEAGFASAAGVPLRVGDRTIGAMNLYATEASGLMQDLDVARRLAKPAAIVLANGSAYRRAHLVNTELEDKLGELATINQAVGALMAKRGCDTRAAKELLLATAEGTGRTIEEVASHLVGGEPPT